MFMGLGFKEFGFQRLGLEGLRVRFCCFGFRVQVFGFV